MNHIAAVRKLGGLIAFLRCCRGSAAVEFVFALPVLILLVFGIIEVAMVMFVMALTEGGLREASRYGITGQIPENLTRDEMILQMVNNHTHGLIDVSGANLTYQVYPSFEDIGKPEPFVDGDPKNGTYDVGEDFTDINGNGQWDPDMGAAGLGGPGEVVLYNIDYQWEFMLPVFEIFGGPDGVLNLSASLAVRNEPYDPLSPQSSTASVAP